MVGVDYPSTFQALDEWFRVGVACRAYIRRLRWPTVLAAQTVGLSRHRHQVTVISGGSNRAIEVMPRVHKSTRLLKRWLLGVLQRGIQHQHLGDYLDEFTFRFNGVDHRPEASCSTASSSRR